MKNKKKFSHGGFRRGSLTEMRRDLRNRIPVTHRGRGAKGGPASLVLALIIMATLNLII